MPRDQIPVAGPSSDFSSIGPSQSASQISSYPFPEPVTNPGPEMLLLSPSNDNIGIAPRRHSVASSTPSSLYHTPGTQTTYKVETVTYAPAVSLVVPPSLPSSPMETNIPLAASTSTNHPPPSSFGIGLPPPLGYASENPEMHATMYIPAAHAINEYEMPTAKVADNAASWLHSRAESQSQEELGHSGQRMSSLAPSAGPTSGPILSHTSSTVNRGGVGVGGGEQKAVPITVAGSALIEVFDEPENIEDDKEEEEDDSELPVEAEEMIKQGKLAVVENPRFMSEERKKELEKERERWMKQSSSDVEKGQQQQQKSEELEPKPRPEPELQPEGKKHFSFLQQHKRTGTQDRVTFAPSTPSKTTPSKGGGETPLPYTSPSKTSPSKRFFGSLRGFFGGGSRPSSSEAVVVPSQVQDSSSSPRSRFRGEPPRTPFPTVDMNAYHGDDDSDDDSDEHPATKTRSGFQTFLWGNGNASAKKKDGESSSASTGRRWSTRTDRNIRKLTKNVGGGDDDEYDTFLSRDVRNNGVAGDIVVNAGLVGGVTAAAATGSREVKKKRSIGTATRGGGGSAVNGGGRKKLKKSIPPPIVTAVPPTSALNHVISSTPQRNDTIPTIPTTNTTITTRDQAHTPADPSSVLRKRSSVKTDDAPKRRSASVDESMRRRKSNVEVQQGVGEVGQTSGGKEAVVDLGKRRRVNSSFTSAPPPVGASSAAREIPAATRTPAAAVGTSSAVSKGYSSDTGATRVARAPPSVTPATASAATATPSKPWVTRQLSTAGKTQIHTPTLTNPPPPIENTGSSRHQSHVQQPPSQPQPQPQPHRQHSTASSSGGGAIVLTTGATQPTGTLVSRPGWDAQALPTAGGGLSRNNSVMSGVSGAAAGGSSSGGGAGGMNKKKQKQTSLGHGMGSGTSLGRRSSLGSSSGHGGGGGGGGGRRPPVIQPTQPAQSLMSIIEDVAKHNREWNQESSQLYKNRNRIVSGSGNALLSEKEKKMGPAAVAGMGDVVKAPRRFGRDELAQLDPAMIKARVMETSTTTNLPPAPAAASDSGGRGRMVDIKAPGSIFDQRDTTATVQQRKIYRQLSNSTPDLTQRQEVNLARRPSGGTRTFGPAATSTPVARSKRPAKSPLRSAMKNPSRTPSPLTSPFLVQKQQQAIQEGSRLAVKSNVVAPVPVPPPAQSSSILGSQQESSSRAPSTTATSAATDIQSTTMANGRATSDSASQRRKGKRQVKGAPDEVVGEEPGESTSTNDTENEVFYTDDENADDEAVVAPMLNGHAVGYTAATSSDLSHSTTSTAVNRLPTHTTTTSPTATTQPAATLVARRRKSVRVSLQPTFSPSPPAVEYDDDKEEQQPWVWKQDHHHHHPEGGGSGQQQQLHVHAPVPVAAGSSLLLNPVNHHQHHHRQKVAEPVHDIWEDSDEDVEYQNAKLLLTRAAKKEKEMNLFAARSRS